MPLGLKPPSQRPFTHAKLRSNCTELHFTVRQQRCNCILDPDLHWAGRLLSQTSKRFFAKTFTQLVEVGIGCYDWILSTFPRKNNFVNIRSGSDRTTEQFRHLRNLLSSVVHNTDFYWFEIGASQRSAETHKRCHPKLNLVYIAVTRDT